MVYFYKDNDMDEILTLCLKCAKDYENIELIDKAGDWDICSDCDTQNVPEFYLGKYDKYGDEK